MVCLIDPRTWNMVYHLNFNWLIMVLNYWLFELFIVCMLSRSAFITKLFCMLMKCLLVDWKEGQCLIILKKLLI